jgi:hypothetical protein
LIEDDKGDELDVEMTLEDVGDYQFLQLKRKAPPRMSRGQSV